MEKTDADGVVGFLLMFRVMLGRLERLEVLELQVPG